MEIRTVKKEDGKSITSAGIKAWLKDNRGGLLITDRQVGKSRALFELLHEEDDSFILACCRNMRNNLRCKYKELFDDGKEERIVLYSGKPDMSKYYIDEYLSHKIAHKHFRGAVSSD